VRAVATLALMLMAAPAVAQTAPPNPYVAPATPTDRAHHYKAYAVAKYGISCPGDRVVWVNAKTGVYHLEGERWFGRTAAEQYECEKAAKADGDRETRNGQ
jgi:hypothetical protein